ncbi:MAG: helix-turn-helix transcriptional regulator [Firmicutes bacterium]|nr:helix-turn-helix transcriptional regulator [Bacillota bacterium]
MKYSTSLVGEIIRLERKRRNWTQQNLSDKLGVSNNQVSKYEKGELVPPIDTLFKLCDIFDCELGYLLGEENYSEGSRLETEIYNLIGLNSESIKVLKSITGTERRSPAFGTKSEIYRSLINALFSANSIFHFFNCLENMAQCINNYNDNIQQLSALENILEEKYRQINWQDYLDYIEEYNDGNVNNGTHFAEIIMTYKDLIYKQEELIYPSKVAKYELSEVFISLIEEMFPQKIWKK